MSNRKLTKKELDECAHPVGFSQSFLGMRLYPKQIEVLNKLAPAGSSVSFVSCNEGGKTTRVIAGAILWHMTVFPKGHIVSTSGSFRQIKSQLVPALHRYRETFPGLEMFRTPRIEGLDPNCYWEGFSTNDGGKFEGHHEDGPDRPLLIIVDEAKTVEDAIFEAVERCKPTRLLLASSPGAPEGEFYRSQTSRSRFYSCIKQTAKECPHITQEWVDRMEDKWGAEHPLVRSMIHAEFMLDIEGSIIKVAHLDRNLANPPVFNKEKEDRRAFCDFAAGGDENVVALRVGNQITLADCWREKDTMSAVGRFISNFVKLGLKPHEIEGDVGGLGKVMCDALQSAGWPIRRFNFGGTPTSKHFVSSGAQIWSEGALKIERGEFIIPDDEDLRGQLISRKYSKNNHKGKIGIERKDEMKSRGLPSCDRADAVLGVMRDRTQVNQSESMVERDDFWERIQANEYSLAGMDAGAY